MHRPVLKSSSLTLILSIALGLGLILPSFASRPARISVTAQGEVRTYPDQADLVLETEVTRAQMKVAMGEVQQAVRAVFAACTPYAAGGGELSAGQISVDKDFRWIKNSQVFLGYRASQSVTLRIKDLDRLGPLLEELSKAKITRINGIYYSHSAEDSLVRAAEAKALENARLSGDGLGRTLGGSLGEVLEVSNYRLSQEEPAGGGFGGRGHLMGYASERKANIQKEFMVKPDMLVIRGQVYASFALGPKGVAAGK